MNRLRALIRSIFGFSRTETNGFLILLPLMVILLFSEPAYRLWKVHRENDFQASRRQLDSVVAKWDFETKKDSIPLQKALFRFNPNTVNEEELLELGVPGNLAQRILNYRSKGGKFFIKSDLMKIYGMDSSLYADLFAYINLPEEKAIPDPLAEKKEVTEKNEVKSKRERTPFDLNLADTIQLKTIYGIGPVLSRRIVSYREKLGGFISYEQLIEVKGLDTAVIHRLAKTSFIQPDFRNTQISINHADEKTLAAHPYIKAKLANAIITYRFQHGNFKTIDDLKKIELVKSENLTKLAPYLTFEE